MVKASVSESPSRVRSTFQMRYRLAGKPARLDLGTYPLLTLKGARAQHLEMKAELEKGHDPRMVKKLERVRLDDRPTNEQLYRQWHRAYCEERKQQSDHYLRTFEIHVFPKLGDLLAEETTANQWMTLIEDVATRTPSIAVRILSTTKQMHKWAHRRGLIATKPLLDITAKEDLNIEREESGRSLDDAEIRLFWHSVERSKMAHRNKLFMKLCLFFGCRNGELRSVDPTKEIDFEAMTWTIPPEKNKVRKRVKKAIVRPIIPEVEPLLREAIELSLSPNLLFTTDSVPKAISPGAVLCMPYSVMLNTKSRFGVDMEHWSMHDLRKTARTNFSTLT